MLESTSWLCFAAFAVTRSLSPFAYLRTAPQKPALAPRCPNSSPCARKRTALGVRYVGWAGAGQRREFGRATPGAADHTQSSPRGQPRLAVTRGSGTAGSGQAAPTTSGQRRDESRDSCPAGTAGPQTRKPFVSSADPPAPVATATPVAAPAAAAAAVATANGAASTSASRHSITSTRAHPAIALPSHPLSRFEYNLE